MFNLKLSLFHEFLDIKNSSHDKIVHFKNRTDNIENISSRTLAAYSALNVINSV